jgi:hypothetical protein
MHYQAPRLTVHGSVEALTRDPGNGNNGNGNNSPGNGIGEQCKNRGTNGLKNNTGVDLNVQNQPENGLGTCSV